MREGQDRQTHRHTDPAGEGRGEDGREERRRERGEGRRPRERGRKRDTAREKCRTRQQEKDKQTQRSGDRKTSGQRAAERVQTAGRVTGSGQKGGGRDARRPGRACRALATRLGVSPRWPGPLLSPPLLALEELEPGHKVSKCPPGISEECRGRTGSGSWAATAKPRLAMFTH